MKKILILISVIFVFAGNAFAESRTGVQFSSGENISMIHYGDKFSWAAGGSVGFMHGEIEIADVDLDISNLTLSVFARKNFKIANNTYFGLGVIGSYGFAEGEIDNDEGEIRTWSVAPYFILDYHLSDNFILNAGAEIIRFNTLDIEINNGKLLEINTFQYMKPFFGVTSFY